MQSQRQASVVGIVSGISPDLEKAPIAVTAQPQIMPSFHESVALSVSMHAEKIRSYTLHVQFATLLLAGVHLLVSVY